MLVNLDLPSAAAFDAVIPRRGTWTMIHVGAAIAFAFWTLVSWWCLSIHISMFGLPSELAATPFITEIIATKLAQKFSIRIGSDDVPVNVGRRIALSQFTAA